MDFTITYSAELETFRKEVGDWLDANRPPLVHNSDPRVRTDEDHHNREQLRRAMGQKGWLYPMGNPKYGGGGLSIDHAVIISEEMEKRYIYGLTESGRFPIACTLVWGTEEQKQEFVTPLMRGEADAFQLLTEPQGGTDLAGVMLSAVRDGDDYILNGQKIFVGNEHKVEWLWTITNSDRTAPRHQNLSYFMIPSDLPGITFQPLWLLATTGGEHPYLHKNIIFFDDVRVPQKYLVGGHNEGWKVSSTHMELEHGGGGSISEDRMYNRLITTLRELQWEGRPLIEDPDVRDVLGEYIQLRDVRRLFSLRNYWMQHSKTRMSHEGPQSSYYGKSRVHLFAQKIQDMLGQYAITRDPKYAVAQGWLETLARTAFVANHVGGGKNIQATITARRLGVGRATREEAGVVQD